MRVSFLALFTALLLPLGVVRAAADGTSNQPEVPTAPAESRPAAELSARDAVVLGLVEGITEYLPISSTGHLIIATKLLGLTEETPILDESGQPRWFKAPSVDHPEGIPLTTKLAADTFTIVIQFGAIAAVALLYWRQLRSMLFGALGRDAAGFRLARNLIIAFLPAGALGFLLNDWTDTLFSVPVVVAALTVGAALMLLAERWRKNSTRANENRGLGDLTSRQALGIGALQCLALWPGMSRSMTTIVGGYLVGLNPQRSAEFSFLLGLVTLSAATAYKSAKSGAAMFAVFGWPNILLGCVIAAITATVAVKFLVSFLARHGLVAFAVYRLVLAGALGVLLAGGFFSS